MELLFLNMTEGSAFMFPLIRLQNFLKLRKSFPHVIKKKSLRVSLFITIFECRLKHNVLILIKCLCIILTIFHLIVYIHRRH